MKISEQHGYLSLATDGEDGQRPLVENIARRRLGSPDDMASGMVCFASEFAGWMTGQTLAIDGGK
jgi:3-oxoacyl-[acyl-carrier protein] reductase